MRHVRRRWTGRVWSVARMQRRWLKAAVQTLRRESDTRCTHRPTLVLLAKDLAAPPLGVTVPVARF